MPTRQSPPPEAFRFAAPVQMTGEKGARRFSGVAYSGQVVKGHGWFGDMVIDLATITTPTAHMAALRDHKPELIVGHGTIQVGDDIRVTGEFVDTPAADEVQRLSDSRFPWQMSVYAHPEYIEDVPAKASVEVNGQKLTGPLTIFRNTAIREFSFTAVGADPNTSGAALTFRPSPSQENRTVSDTEELAKLRAELDAEKKARAEADAKLTASSTAHAALQAEVEKQAKDARLAAIKALFSDCGIAFSDEAAKPYAEMGADSFEAAAKNLRELRKAGPAGLFSHQATGGTGSETENAAPAPPKGALLAAVAKMKKAAGAAV